MSVTVVSLGVHVLDVLVRPVEAIPEGQGGQLVEEIRMTAAGRSVTSCHLLPDFTSTPRPVARLNSSSLFATSSRPAR